ncbi:Protein Y54G9A.7, partial [Aphelenchoides avenae]
AKQEWSLEVAPTGRKKYPHWSQLMTIEELFSVDKGDYIDKRAGLPNEEDAAKLAAMRAEYIKKYVLVKPGETTDTAADASRKKESGSGDK